MPEVTIYPEYDASVVRSAAGSYASVVDGDGTGVSTTSHVVVASVVVTYFVWRVYSRFDTTSIPTNAIIKSATIKRYFYQVVGTNTQAEIMRLTKSDDLSSDDASLYQSITSTHATTTTDVGNDFEWETFTIDGDLLTYLQTQVTAGNKTAVLLRTKLDYNENPPSAQEQHYFYGLDDDDVSGTDYRPYLTVNYIIPVDTNFDFQNGTVHIGSDANIHI